jgi:hypothetical protein
VEIEHLAAVIRPRTSWEALDLGFALARHWFLRLLVLWWLAVLPVGLLGLFWLGRSPGLWLILVWWFKPLYEAPLLYWLGRRLFAEPPGMGELWRSRGQIFTPRLLPSLLWRRLTPSRSFQMPLILLEGLGGEERRRRQQVLQGPGGAAGWLTIIGVHLESILWISATLLIAIMIPEELPGLDLSAALMEPGSAAYWVSTVVYLIAMSVMAPFYVAAGFALYLARRTELEAWDLELQFRRFVGSQGRRPIRGAGPAAAAAVTLLAGVAFALPRPLYALDLTPEEARAEMGAILASDDFGRAREVPIWVYVGDGEAAGEPVQPPDWLAALLRALERGGELGAAALEWLVYLAAAVLLLALLSRILRLSERRRRIRSQSFPDATGPGATSLPRAAGLPTDVATAVRGRIADGDTRGGLALLYAASIALLARRHGLEIAASATEAECLERVLERRPAREAALMRRLLLLWQRRAYAHREPAPGELADLLQDWQLWAADVDGA